MLCLNWVKLEVPIQCSIHILACEVCNQKLNKLLILKHKLHSKRHLGDKSYCRGVVSLGNTVRGFNVSCLFAL